jgi:hypothetical protein
MNQAHGNYNTREGVLMPSTYRRKLALCSPVSTPERATDTKLTYNKAAVAREMQCVNVPDAQLIAAAKEVLMRCKLDTLIVLDSREAAVAVIFGIHGERR